MASKHFTSFGPKSSMYQPTMALSSFFTMCFFMMSFNVLVQVQASHYVLQDLQYESLNVIHNEKQPYRTSYHFQPRRNWINDPNGPMIYKGIYHLFYQYNPKGAYFSNYIVWGHSTSTDLVNWTRQVPALVPSIPSDIESCWSGSATILPNNRPAILYTGVTRKHDQVQNIAFPKNISDPYLREWVKPPQNPIIALSQVNGVNVSAFRDPSTAWRLPDGGWRMVIGTMVGRYALAALYASQDFVRWAKLNHPLYEESDKGVWECVDFYPVHGQLGLDTTVVRSTAKYVFKVSKDDTRHDYYVIGKYDFRRETFTPDRNSIRDESGPRYDYGIFYASKTFYDAAKRRRILWGWVNETSNLLENLKKGWAGIQAIPRTILLDKSRRQLVQWPVEEIERLRRGQVNLPDRVINGGSRIHVGGVTASQADVEVTFKLSGWGKVEKLDKKWSDPKQLCKAQHRNGGLGPFGLLTLASKSLEEYTSVFFKVFKNNADKPVVLMCSDQSRSSLSTPPYDEEHRYYGSFVQMDPLREELSLRTLIDHSVVESFGSKGKSCITARVYPKLAIDNNAHLFIFNNGTESVQITSFRAWSMRKAQIG